MKGDIRTTHAMRLGFRQISGFSEDARRCASKPCAGAASTRCAISGCARGCRPPRWNGSPMRTRSARSASTRRDALWAVRALQRAGDKDDLPLFARVAMPELEPDAALPPMPPGEQVVEDYRHLHLSLKAHPVSFLRAELDRARHHAARASAGHPIRRARHRRGPGAGAPAAGHRQGRDLHDAGGRDRHRQHDRVGSARSRRSARS